MWCPVKESNFLLIRTKDLCCHYHQRGIRKGPARGPSYQFEVRPRIQSHTFATALRAIASYGAGSIRPTINPTINQNMRFSLAVLVIYLGGSWRIELQYADLSPRPPDPDQRLSSPRISRAFLRNSSSDRSSLSTISIRSYLMSL